MKSIVYKTGKANFNSCGQLLGHDISETSEEISHGLVARLHWYALRRLDAAGFANGVKGWSVVVDTNDADEKPTDRAYCVRFINDDGGELVVQGIFTRNGWPFLDHGLDIDG